MDDRDIKRMREAIKWAETCSPVEESIPKVGCIIAIEDEVLARGRRGAGLEGDGEHAERNAILRVLDTKKLAGATLYTTLEPCTREVRTKPYECCTELIHQHQIRKVFVGMLDPNQGVTGKGLLTLQESGVEVELFPHEMAQQIRALNAPFVRSQQRLGATIISPKNGEELKTYKTAGKHTVRFNCRTPPGANNYLLAFRERLCWPQSDQFRKIEEGIWETDAHFGTRGNHTLYLVTMNELGKILVDYYWKVVDFNKARREKLKQRFPNEDFAFLGGDYPGIEMNELAKGFQTEASVVVSIEAKP